MSIKILKQIKSVTFSLLAISSFSFANENCEALIGCAEKTCQVEKQIEIEENKCQDE